MANSLFSQHEVRLYGGLGTKNDVKFAFGIDQVTNFVNNKDLRYDFGTTVGIYHQKFETDDLATDSRTYFQFGFHVKYKLLERLYLRGDFGGRHPFSNDNYSLKDASGNTLPDSKLGGHFYSFPSLEIRLSKRISAFLLYNFGFEDAVDMETFKVGLLWKL